MLYLIGYDVSTTEAEGKKRLAKVSKIYCNYGQRVQNSLFECNLNGAQYITLKTKLLEVLKSDEDSLRIYNLGNKYANKIEHYGVKETYDAEGDLIF